jgi:hypothetical protein
VRPTLVLGVGRSGTSAVARALHEEGGVVMGIELDDQPSRQHPRGSYEDLEVRRLHKAYLEGEIHRTSFEGRLDTMVAMRAVRSVPWGVKEPRMCLVARTWFERLPEARVVVCERDFPAVLASWDRLYGGSSAEHRREIEARALFLEASLVATEKLREGPVIRLDMNVKRSSDWILEKVLEPV